MYKYFEVHTDLFLFSFLFFSLDLNHYHLVSPISFSTSIPRRSNKVHLYLYVSYMTDRGRFARRTCLGVIAYK